MGIYKGIDICRASISPYHKIPHDSSFIMRDPAHVLHYRTRQQYRRLRDGTMDREKEGLWLIVGSNTMKRTRVVRSWARRRLYSAIQDQLKAQGFDVTGRKIESGKAQVSYNKANVERLIGSVNVWTAEQSILYKYDKLLEQAGLLVQNIIYQCGER